MQALFEKVINDVADAGYAICDDFLPADIVQGLRNNLSELYSEGDLRKAGIGKWNNYQKDLEIRSDRIRWLSSTPEDPVELQLMNIVREFTDYLNRTCFTGIRSYEFHYAVYPKGSFYKRHLDQFSNDPGRKFTMIFYLNENWLPEDGGQLVIFLNGRELEVQPLAGRLVFFESSVIEHEVRPANRERMSVTGWLKNVEISLPL